MRRSLVAVLVLPALGFFAGTADAQCDFQHPLKTIEMRLPLVPAFVSCAGACNFCGIPETSTQSPNSSTDTGVVSCKPPQTYNEQIGPPTNSNGWIWGPKSTGSVRFRAVRNKVSGLPFNTADVAVRIELNDINDSAGLVGTRDMPRFGYLTPSSRASVEARANGDMTVVDLAVPSFPVRVVNGKAKVKTSVNTAFAPYYSLPGCTLLELLKVELTDENGTLFAVPGLFLPNIDDPLPTPTPTATPTPTDPTPTTTPTPPATRCCEVQPPGSGCADLPAGASPNEVRNHCDRVTAGTGTLAPQGEVCDGATGACAAMRTGQTFCCYFPHPISGDQCLEGPTWDMDCAAGTSTANDLCRIDGTCGPP